MKGQAIVKKKRKTRKGRGFSRNELKEVGLSIRQALRLQIQIDPRRTTKHEENLIALKAYLDMSAMKTQTPKTDIVLTKVKGVGPKLSEKLTKAGIVDAIQLAASSPETITKAMGVSKKRASTLIDRARSLLEKE